MVFEAKVYIGEQSELIFFVRQLNDNDIIPRLNGREVNIRLTGESLVNICWVISLYESLPNKSDQNSLSFTIFGDQ